MSRRASSWRLCAASGRACGSHDRRRGPAADARPAHVPEPYESGLMTVTTTQSPKSAMSGPKVSFIVPCYKLAHLLPQCVESILSQTHRNLEVLIMDDCSPDDTPAVAASFKDERVRHVRNEPNLGHLRNYNKGIALARGDYIWLISADDLLRRPYVLERYVDVMEADRRIGFAFCTGMGLRDGVETDIVGWADLKRPDAVLKGRDFLRRLLESNCVLAPAGMVRRECYERLGAFPTDLPFAGDWYLWCLFALHYDAAYFAEPMVNYREHSASMTDTLIGKDIRLLARDDLHVRWRMLRHIEAAGDESLARHCVTTLVGYYRDALTSKRWRGGKYRMTLAEFDASLVEHVADGGERAALRAEVLRGVGRDLHWDPDLQPDLDLYRAALQHGPSSLALRVKYTLLRCGAPGRALLSLVAGARRGLRGRKP
ncbi:MAG: glycosyltransferase [Proteobacteria bacterium]|nr:glycosyltransferase [Pseudomonadota bacterium]